MLVNGLLPSLLVSVIALGMGKLPAKTSVRERIAANDNRRATGTLASGVLTLRLDVREGEWRPDGEGAPPIVVRAFGEEGKALQVPGPLVRVPRGTVIHVFVRNSLGDSTLIVRGLAAPSATGGGATDDTLRVRPGEVREVRFTASHAGTYYYWAAADGARNVGRSGRDSQLGGAIIVDDPAAPRDSAERVFILSLWEQRGISTGVITPELILRFAINGRSWPNTERLSYAVGDTVRFRLVNLSAAPHPMHLHGFYFNVDSRGNGRTDRLFDKKGPHHLVVTERMPSGGTMSLTWVPERAGNWLFHCHDNYHVLRNRPIDGTPLPPEHKQHVQNHTEEMMGGLVMGVTVAPRGAEQHAPESSARRRLRLVVREDSGSTEAEPAYGYQLDDGRTLSPAKSPLLPGPTIVVRRGEPVAITVVNRLSEPTAVHWHGIELESYYDGVAGFSGTAGRISPVIAPRDSFVAYFTPPRAGTFMYHPHADEVRQQHAGLSGALVVVEPGVTRDDRDVLFLVSTPRYSAELQQHVYINGSKAPPPMEWVVGTRYRLRVVNIHSFRPSMIARIERDTVLVSWRAIAKDGMDLDPREATVRPARVQMGNGETFDYEFTPESAGDLRLRVTTGTGQTLATLPIRVRASAAPR